VHHAKQAVKETAAFQPQTWLQSFRFLDVASGDASATGALKGRRVASYQGIDLSQAALDLASQALETLACPVTLDRHDFVERYTS